MPRRRAPPRDAPATAATAPGGVGLRDRLGVLLRRCGALLCGWAGAVGAGRHVLRRVDLLHHGGVHPAEPEWASPTARRHEPRRSADWWAAAIQFFGTLCFNVSTGVALARGDRRPDAVGAGWRPDAWGSVAFLVSSVLAVVATRDRGHLWDADARTWHGTWLNMLGSVAFGASAVGAYVVPETGRLRERVLGQPRHAARCGLLLRCGAVRGRSRGAAVGSTRRLIRSAVTAGRAGTPRCRDRPVPPRAAAAAAVAPQDERQQDRDDGPRDRARDVDPVVGEVEAREVGTERARRIHGRARDRAAPQSGERDVATDADRTDRRRRSARPRPCPG